ncbi:hypothetical protein DFJ74DRAFT_400053, partial [Hyaloraphidium curvatum]
RLTSLRALLFFYWRLKTNEPSIEKDTPKRDLRPSPKLRASPAQNHAHPDPPTVAWAQRSLWLGQSERWHSAEQYHAPLHLAHLFSSEGSLATLQLPQRRTASDPGPNRASRAACRVRGPRTAHRLAWHSGALVAQMEVTSLPLPPAVQRMRLRSSTLRAPQEMHGLRNVTPAGGVSSGTTRRARRGLAIAVSRAKVAIWAAASVTSSSAAGRKGGCDRRARSESTGYAIFAHSRPQAKHRSGIPGTPCAISPHSCASSVRKKTAQEAGTASMRHSARSPAAKHIPSTARHTSAELASAQSSSASYFLTAARKPGFASTRFSNRRTSSDTRSEPSGASWQTGEREARNTAANDSGCRRGRLLLQSARGRDNVCCGDTSAVDGGERHTRISPSAIPHGDGTSEREKGRSKTNDQRKLIVSLCRNRSFVSAKWHERTCCSPEQLGRRDLPPNFPPSLPNHPTDLLATQAFVCFPRAARWHSAPSTSPRRTASASAAYSKPHSGRMRPQLSRACLSRGAASRCASRPSPCGLAQPVEEVGAHPGRRRCHEELHEHVQVLQGQNRRGSDPPIVLGIVQDLGGIAEELARDVEGQEATRN